MNVYGTRLLKMCSFVEAGRMISETQHVRVSFGSHLPQLFADLHQFKE